MPASFKVRVIPCEGNEGNGTEEILEPDFGEAAIGRVAPVDSGKLRRWYPLLLTHLYLVLFGNLRKQISLHDRSMVDHLVESIWLEHGRFLLARKSRCTNRYPDGAQALPYR